MNAEPAISLASVVVRNDGLLMTEVDGEVILLSTAQGLYFGLDLIGTEIWKQLARPMNVAGLCAALAERYEEPEPGAIERDVLDLLAELHEKQLVMVPR